MLKLVIPDKLLNIIVMTVLIFLSLCPQQVFAERASVTAPTSPSTTGRNTSIAVGGGWWTYYYASHEGWNVAKPLNATYLVFTFISAAGGGGGGAGNNSWDSFGHDGLFSHIRLDGAYGSYYTSSSSIYLSDASYKLHMGTPGYGGGPGSSATNHSTPGASGTSPGAAGNNGAQNGSCPSWGDNKTIGHSWSFWEWYEAAAGGGACGGGGGGSTYVTSNTTGASYGCQGGSGGQGGSYNVHSDTSVAYGWVANTDNYGGGGGAGGTWGANGVSCTVTYEYNGATSGGSGATGGNGTQVGYINLYWY